MTGPQSLTRALRHINGNYPSFIQLIRYFFLVAALAVIAAAITPFWVNVSADFPYDLYPTAVAIELIQNGKMDAIYHPTIFVRGDEYNPAWVETAQRLGILRANVSYVYHPFYAGLLSLFVRGANPQDTVQLIYMATLISVGIVSLEIVSLIPGASRILAFSLAVVITCSAPYVEHIKLGQNSLIALAAACSGLRLLMSTGRTSLLGGGLLLLGCLAKPWVVICFSAFLFTRQFRTFAILIVSYLVLFEALPWLILPSEVPLGFWNVRRALSIIRMGAFNDFSLHASLLRLYLDVPWTVTMTWARDLATPDDFKTAYKVISSTILGALVIGALRFKGDKHAAAALALALPLAVVGVAWDHYFFFCLPLVAVSISQARNLPLAATLSIILVIRLERAPLARTFTPENFMGPNGQISAMVYLALPYILLISVILLLLYRCSPHLIPHGTVRDIKDR